MSSVRQLEKFFKDYTSQHFYPHHKDDIVAQILGYMVEYIKEEKHPYKHFFQPIIPKEDLKKWQSAIIRACIVSDQDFPKGWENFALPPCSSVMYHNKFQQDYTALEPDQLAYVWVKKYQDIILLKKEIALGNCPPKRQENLKFRDQLLIRLVREYHFSYYAERLCNYLYEVFEISAKASIPNIWLKSLCPPNIDESIKITLGSSVYSDFSKASQPPLPLNESILQYYEEKHKGDIVSKTALRKALQDGKLELLRGFKTKLQIRAFLVLLVLLKQNIDKKLCDNIGSLIIGFTCSKRDLYFVAQLLSANNKGDAQDVVNQIQELQGIPYEIQVNNKTYINPIVQGFKENENQTYTIALNVEFCMKSARGYQELSLAGLRKIRKYNLNTHRIFFFLQNKLTNKNRFSVKSFSDDKIKQSYSYVEFYDKTDVNGFQYPNKKNKAIIGYFSNLEEAGLISDLVTDQSGLKFNISLQDWNFSDRIRKMVEKPATANSR